MLSLAYRIASMKPVIPPVSSVGFSYDQSALRERLDAAAQLISKSSHFRFDNVADFYAAHDQQIWDMSEDIPNCAPPFSTFFVEWNEPQAWNIHHREAQSKPGQHGVFVLASHVNDENRHDWDSWKMLLDYAVGALSPWPDDLINLARKALQESRWVLCCDRWSTAFERPLCGAPFWLGLQSFLFVSPQGKVVAYTHGGICLRHTATLFGQEVLASPLHILGLGLSFCHCKNVRRQEAIDDQGERWHRRSGVPRIKFYTLDINPMRETLRRDGKSDEVGIKKALHICRGHFAHYTPESPLFGKYVGTFWRPDHVRGSKESGEVHKNYEVKAPVAPQV